MVKRKRNQPIHASIRNALGYEASQSDTDIYEDWKDRTSRVCKPCWELKYCPYGPLVEQLPLLPSLRKDADEQISYFTECVATGMVGELTPLSDERRALYQQWSEDEQVLLKQALFDFRQKAEFEAADKLESKEEKITAWLGNGLPPVHIYRAPFEIKDRDVVESDFSPEMWHELKASAKANKRNMLEALKTGQDDNRTPLEPVRRAWFEARIAEFDPNEHPDDIPEQFSESQCNIFGHICPVFFAAEGLTETQEERRIGRHQLSFQTMMRIVRRDDYRCQHCKEKLRDDEVEFDHIIPVSKGGSSEEHNLRLTCFDCNRDKGGKYKP
jgi:hypothetical protein